MNLSLSKLYNYSLLGFKLFYYKLSKGEWMCSSMKEKTIEQKLVSEIKLLKGLCLKLSCPGFSGMPDRLILLPKGKIGFVEVKRKGEKPRPLQVSRHKLLSALGFKVFVLDDKKQIEEIIEIIQGGDAR